MTEHTPGGMRASIRFHPQRNRLLAEAHARPSTPLKAPALACRIAAMSGEGGAEMDRAHMAALCRRFGQPEPGPGARWSVLDAGGWRLRWERHTEFSTWTFYRPAEADEASRFGATALSLVPQDWLAALPGEALAAAHVALVGETPEMRTLMADDWVGVSVAGGAAQVHTDFRPGPDGFTRFLIVQPEPDATLAGRILQQLFEIETYRLVALLAFPLATEVGQELSRLEAEAAIAAQQVAGEGGIEADRALLTGLARLAGEAEALSARTSFRFGAARAYHGLVLERIAQLRETRLEGRPTIGEFMERRLAPAMRTCASVAERQQAVSDRIARTAQMLNTRVEVAAEVTNAGLLASMDRRAHLQLRLQETVEGLSVMAIAYYGVGLIGFLLKGLTALWPGFNPDLAVALIAPVVVIAVWLAVRRMRERLSKESGLPADKVLPFW